MKKFTQSMVVLALAAVVLLAPALVLARVGVGVGVGKIELSEQLKPGGIYELPSLPVLNTGDEAGDYETSIEYHENIPQLWPSREWFKFSPRTFYLEPGKVQTVATTLSLPLKVKPGDYFAYLEAHPVKKDTTSGGASIGVAAAAKLYFTIAPANFFQGIYYKTASLLTKYSPWSYVLLVVIFAGIVVVILRKNFTFNLGISVAKRRKDE